MTSMNFIFLAGNNFTAGPIPNLTALENLTELSLRGTRRVGGIPNQWTNHINLQFLDLSYNSLTGSLPESLGNLDRVLFLLFNRNQLTGQVPDSFTNLTRLSLVYMDHNKLNGTTAPICVGSRGLPIFVTDCQMECECCSDCCVDDDSCNANVANVNMDPNWEDKFLRTTFFFGGSILFKAPQKS